MGLTDRLDAFQQRHPWAGFPLAVAYKFVDDQGNYLAALITYYGFLSVFPLLLLFSSVLGFALNDDAELQRKVLDSTLSQFPVIGDQLAAHSLRGSAIAVIVGIVASVYGALGVAQATQNAMNVVWSVPRYKRPNPLWSRLRSLLLLSIAGVALLVTTILSALGGSGGAFGASLGVGGRVLVTVASVALNAVVFIFLFRIATAHKLGLRDAVPGAVIAAIGWQLLHSVGTAFVGNVIKDATATNGVFAFVLGLIVWIYLGAGALVLSAEINVVRTRRLYPRALLTPFTENVDLTRADQQAYSDSATAQRTKDFERVDVTFDDEGQNATAQREA